MKSRTVIILILWFLIYTVFEIVFFRALNQPLIIFSAAIGVGLIVVGTYISTLKSTSDSYGRTQQYIIATTIQILGALGYILFARFAASNEFKDLALHFLVAFITSLIIQSIFLIRALRL